MRCNLTSAKSQYWHFWGKRWRWYQDPHSVLATEVFMKAVWKMGRVAGEVLVLASLILSCSKDEHRRVWVSRWWKSYGWWEQGPKFLGALKIDCDWRPTLEGSRLPGDVILLKDDSAREGPLMTKATVIGSQAQTWEAKVTFVNISMEKQSRWAVFGLSRTQPMSIPWASSSSQRTSLSIIQSFKRHQGRVHLTSSSSLPVPACLVLPPSPLHERNIFTCHHVNYLALKNLQLCGESSSCNEFAFGWIFMPPQNWNMHTYLTL